MPACRKLHPKSDLHSSGISQLNVYAKGKSCLVSAMTEMDGVNTTLSVLLSTFPVLPWLCHYNDRCNMTRSIKLRAF